jgi:hypothetical protein
MRVNTALEEGEPLNQDDSRTSPPAAPLQEILPSSSETKNARQNLSPQNPIGAGGYGLFTRPPKRRVQNK